MSVVLARRSKLATAGEQMLATICLVLLFRRKEHTTSSLTCHQSLSLQINKHSSAQVISSREHRIQRHIATLATELVLTQQCELVIEVPWCSRPVRPGALLFDLSRQLHRTWVPLCARRGKVNDGMHADGWSIVTTARTVWYVLRGRSCDELHRHRPQQLAIPFLASLETFVAESLRSCCTRFPLKTLVGKQTIPPAGWASESSSSSAPPEVPAEPQNPADQPRNVAGRNPVG